MTVREGIEAGLMHVLGGGPAVSKPFRLNRRPFKGRGPAQRESWPKIRAKIHEGRGA